MSALRQLSRSMLGRATGRFGRALGGSTTLRATGKFLRRQLWVWPIVAAIILIVAGTWVSSVVESELKKQMAGELQTILKADVAAVRVWIKGQETNVRLVAGDAKLQAPITELLQIADGPEPIARNLLQSKALADLRSHLEKRLQPTTYAGFFVVSPKMVIVASDQDTALGKVLTGYRQEFFESITALGASVSRPFRSPMLLQDEKGEYRANLPSMFTAATLPDQEGGPLAMLGLRIRPDEDFTRIFQTARAGQTGEVYAIDKDGLFLSNSRFDDELKEIGLLADFPEVQSILTLHNRNPGANVPKGERPKLRRHQQPLTEVAANVVAGNAGVDVEGYLDYRGVPTLGAWTWLPEYDFGIVAEIDRDEAYQPLFVLRWAFWSLIGLLGLSSVAIFLFMLFAAKQQRALQEAVLAARQLGQYALEEKLGAGGMGTVYRAHHAMLRRPTAVKLLDIDKVSDAAVARFEREVQLTSALTHPNTIAIYDYGRTPEGLFYYAMEYLEGTNLEDLVTRYGPLPENRAIYLLRQMCGSLAEAHAVGLIHRDVKPANVFVTQRGGLRDFIKVLDFGLVKSMGGSEDAGLTGANAITGTPLYLSPEAANQPDKVDARADVYALGAVAYFLLTATPVFQGTSVVDIVFKHVQARPEPLSERLGKEIMPTLEALILRCLAKKPEERPHDAAALLRELDSLPLSQAWTSALAATWWENPTPKPETVVVPPVAPVTLSAKKSAAKLDQTMAFETTA